MTTESQSTSELLSLLPPSSSILQITSSSSSQNPTLPSPSTHNVTTTPDFLSSDPPPQSHDAIILLYPHNAPGVITKWGDFHAAIYRYSEAVRAGGYLLFGNLVPTDNDNDNNEDEGEWDESETYWFRRTGRGGMGFGLSEEGAVRVFESMGLEVVYDEGDEEGERQWVIVRRRSGEVLRAPEPLPTS